jgi:hypothetical protein
MGYIMRNHRAAGGTLVLLAVVSLACGTFRSGHSGASGADPQPPAARTTGPATEVDTASTEPPSTGTVEIDYGGDERVACSAVDVEFTVTARDGPIVWTAEARDRQPIMWPYNGSPAQGIDAEPGTGVLAEGQSAVVHVRGAYSGSEFFIAVSAPNRTGHSAVTLRFACS